MLLLGLQKTTLIDFPGRVAATVFTGGCNFRCPFCHNPELVLPEAVRAAQPIQQLEFFRWLAERKKELDGVCVTGGEPTLHAELPDFLRKIRRLGFATKLDSNGSRPEVLRALLEEGLLDAVAMDIKNSPARYAETAGNPPGFSLEKIEESIALLRGAAEEGKIEVDFRTTIARELHGKKELEELASWLANGQLNKEEEEEKGSKAGIERKNPSPSQGEARRGSAEDLEASADSPPRQEPSPLTQQSAISFQLSEEGRGSSPVADSNPPNSQFPKPNTQFSLQNFRDSGKLLAPGKKLSSFSAAELEEFRKLFERKFPRVRVLS
jgi:pyruvate formate lyase activating enzyme